MDEEIFFNEQEEELESETQDLPPWKIVIADDEEGVHNITKMVLRDYAYEGRKLHFLSTYSGQETRELLREHKDVALLLLDVVMETETAGLETVRFIREELKNDTIKIVLRTGQPGQAPEPEIIIKYEINDYKSKVELTTQKLFTTITSSLRAYKLSHSLDILNKDLQLELQESSNLFDFYF